MSTPLSFTVTDAGQTVPLSATSLGAAIRECLRSQDWSDEYIYVRGSDGSETVLETAGWCSADEVAS